MTYNPLKWHWREAFSRRAASRLWAQCSRQIILTALSVLGLIANLIAGEYLIALIWLYFVVANLLEPC